MPGRKDLTSEELDTIFKEAEYSKSTEASTLNQDQTLQEISTPTSSGTSLYEGKHNYIQPLSQGINTSRLCNMQTISHATCWVAGSGMCWDQLNNALKSSVYIS